MIPIAIGIINGLNVRLVVLHGRIITDWSSEAEPGEVDVTKQEQSAIMNPE